MKAINCCATIETMDAALDVAEALAADPVNAPAPQDDPQYACAACDAASRPVTRKTMLLMLKPELFDQLGDAEYRFCSAPDCRIVYFTESAGRSFTTHDVRVRVGLKERDGEIPLCYCFGFDEATAREEIRRVGRSMLPHRIAEFVKQGMCACPARNPSGACCLGEVNKAINRLMAETTVVEQSG